MSEQDEQLERKVLPLNFSEEPVEDQNTLEVRRYQTKQTPPASSEDQVRQVLEVATDITERKPTEGEPMESEARYRLLFESNPHPMWVYDLETLQFLAVNEAAVLHYGYSREEFLAMAITNIRPPEDIPALVENISNVAEGLDEAGVWRHRKKDGNLIEVEITSHQLIFSGRRAELVLAHDVTERNKAEVALRQAGEKYRSIFENAVEGIFQSTPDGRFISVNPAMARMYGYESPEVMIATQTNIGQRHYVDPARREEFKRLLEKQGIVQGFESEVYRQDGSKFWASESVRVVQDKEGTAHYYEGTIEDITERKRAEEILREADQRAIHDYERLLNRVASLALALGNAHDLIVVFRALRDFSLLSTPMNGLFISLYDPEQQMRTAAYAWSEGEEVDVATLPPMEMTDSPLSRAVSTGQIIITDDFQLAMKEKRVVNIGLDIDPRLPQSSLAVPMSVMGRIVGAVEVQSIKLAAFSMEHATALQMAANLVANAIENVRLLESERAQAEQLRQSQKLESVGKLAGGIAHDFNNLLTAIMGYSDLALRKLKPDDPISRHLGEIIKAAERAAALTHQLLAFSRKQVLEPKVIDLNDVVSDTDKLLRRLIGENIHMITMSGPGLWRIKADPVQLSQVIINLAVNARDAMPQGGKLTIETKNVELDEAYSLRHIAVRAGPYVMLAVSDTGHGMDAEIQKQIFEPYFTTKEVGKGTGLGLSMVYGVVKQSGGNIWVYSEPGIGTTFKIYLPRVEEAVEMPQPDVVLPELPRGMETILLVEDEEMVRMLLNDILKGEGYTVLTAANGKEALQICEQHKGPLHLLVTDVIMPEMSGPQLVERLTQNCADAKVLYMSGYTDDAIVHHGVLDAGTNFLQKPFTQDAVARKIREVLDSES